MAGSWKWRIESKDFELLVKDGANGARFFERNGKRQRSIFLLKDELAWLDRKSEELVKGDHAEVFWDQTRAGYPRIMALKRSNRNGNFLEIEEYDSRGRCGSIIIPEGRYGQGWERLKVHVSRAFASLRVPRITRESAMVTGRRSFAEVVGLSQNQSEECFNAYSEPIARVPLWLKETRSREAQVSACLEKTKKAGTGLNPVMDSWVSGKVLGHGQTLAKDGAKVEKKKAGDGPVTEAGPRDSGKAVACAEQAGRFPACPLRRPVTSSSSRETLLPSISEKPVQERLIGREELVGDGHPTLSVRMELLDIKRVLTGLMCEVDGGIKRLDAALGLLGCSGPKAGLSGSSVMHDTMGDPGSQPVGPKHRKNKKRRNRRAVQWSQR
jgi:hypothetical protein